MPRYPCTIFRGLPAWLILLLPWVVTAADSPRSQRDLTYAIVDGQSLHLDLHMPANVATPPLVVYLHGGAWSAGDKTQYPIFLVENGFAVASVDFRSTNEAPFPANVHDIKAAIRYLRANAAKHGYRADRIALAGASSGGHLAALVGTTQGEARLEGDEGIDMAQSSAVQAIVSWSGASDLTTILAQSTPFGLTVRVPALQRLLGAQPETVPELAKLASPIFHVDARDPPLLLLHGDQDAQMPVNQALELEGAYRKAGVPVELFILNGFGHVDDSFFQGTPANKVVIFLQRALAGRLPVGGKP
jgi:acetyl esterase/lipase